MHFRPIENHYDAATRCLAILSTVVLCGTLAFHATEDWTLWECLYFTLITITTVGYGDQGLSETGERVAALLLVGGIGTFTYSLSTLVQVAMDEDGKQIRRMKRMINESSNHIIVCGYGRMGQTICRQLELGGVPCVVVECDEHNAKLARKEGQLVVMGVASEDEVLTKAGIKRARGVVCAVNTDAENMFITVTAHDLNPECTIVARAESRSAVRKLRHAGATLTISPHEMAGESAADALLNPVTTRLLSGDDDREQFLVSEATICEQSSLVDKTLEFLFTLDDKICFVALKQADGNFIVRPPVSQRLQAGDVMIFASQADEAQQIRQFATHPVLSA